ncbi:MAG: hypothetical protein ACYCQK_01320 [Acidiferrobacteraceae bacterium]
MASTVDDVVAGQLNSSIAGTVNMNLENAAHDRQRLRSSFDMLQHFANGAIGNVMLQASLPTQDAGLNAAMRTPGDVGQTGSIIPSGSVTGGGVAASK